ncbi:hypothetical protein PFH44_04935 [Raoultella sp. Ech2A]|uniref:hypothetical protein n=1 Tax=Raoultella TaxID=160674 RepID=UPI0005F829E8|nr:MULTISPECIES: hypothetical protein [Raoultella]MDJ1652852.1 hypothetical protein [Raoultella sp. Ech2A]
MSNPAYLWFIDENGSPIVGGSMVLGDEDSIEVKSLSHHLTIPTDRNTGCYETIQWKYTDGNIIFKDGWNERATA